MKAKEEEAPIRLFSEIYSEEEALAVLRDEFQMMSSFDQAKFLAKLRGSVGRSFILVPVGENGLGRLIETQKALLEILGEPRS